jgi:hypothetical protein
LGLAFGFDPAIWLIIKIQKSKVVADVKVTDSSEKK